MDIYTTDNLTKQSVENNVLSDYSFIDNTEQLNNYVFIIKNKVSLDMLFQINKQYLNKSKMDLLMLYIMFGELIEDFRLVNDDGDKELIIQSVIEGNPEFFNDNLIENVFSNLDFTTQDNDTILLPDGNQNLFLSFVNNVFKQLVPFVSQLKISQFAESIKNDTFNWNFIQFKDYFKNFFGMEITNNIFGINNNILYDFIKIPQNYIKSKLTEYNFFEYNYCTRLDQEKRLVAISKELGDNLMKNTSVKLTDFEIQNISYNTTVKLQKTFPLQYIFDNLVPTEQIPFISFGQFFKIHSSFQINESFENSTTTMDDVIKLNVLEKDSYSVKTLKYNVDSLIMAHSNQQDSELLKTICLLKLKLSTPQTVNIKGVFVVKNQEFNKYIMSHLVLVNPTFSNYLLKQDNITQTTKKTDLVRSSLLLYFFIPDRVDKMTISITPRKNKEITIKVNGPDMNAVNTCKEIMGRLISIYNKEFDSLFTFYKKYISSFEKQLKEFDKVIVNPSMLLRQQLPDVFESRYSSLCELERNPIIIDINKLDEIPGFNPTAAMLNNQGNLEALNTILNSHTKFMLFPKDDSFVQRRWFYCSKNIGLIENKLSNKNVLPYLPCCFDKPQKNTERYKNYFANKPPVKDKKYNLSRFLTTSKFASVNQHAIMSEIQELFSQELGNQTIVRKGVMTTTDSVLECILMGLYNDDFNSMNEVEKKNKIYQDRQSLISLEYNVARQEMWDFTNDEITSFLRDENRYIDPAYFIRILEKFYNCKIYLIVKEKAKTFISSPRNVNGHFINKSTIEKPCIILYQHYGGIWSNVKKTELVGIYNPPLKTFTFNFKQSSLFIKQMEKCFRQTNVFFINQKILKPQSIPSGNIVKQYIDLYGKTLGIMLDTGLVIILTIPIAPLDVPLMSLDTLYTPNSLESFTGKVGIKQDLRSNVVIVALDERSIVILDTTILLENVPQQPIDFNIISTKTITDGEQFKDLKKFSLLLKEYIITLYSKWLINNKKVHSTLVFSQYFNKLVKITPNTTSLFVFNYLIKDNPNTIKVPDETTFDAIFTTIDLLMRRVKINEYKDVEYFKKYYENIQDFIQYPEVVIIKGQRFLNQWYNIKENLWEFSSKIIVPVKDELINIDGKVYIKQPTMSLNNALYISKQWENTGVVETDGEVDNLIYYITYNNNNDLTSFYKKGNLQNNHKITLMGFVKKFQKTRFVSLLDYSLNKKQYFYRLKGINYIVQPCTDVFSAMKCSLFWAKFGFNAVNVKSMIHDVHYKTNLYKVNNDSGIINTMDILPGIDSGYTLSVAAVNILGVSYFMSLLPLK
jgi:hypothetical protein